MTVRRTHLLLAPLAAVLLTAGCGSTDGEADPSGTAAGSSSSAAGSSSEPAPAEAEASAEAAADPAAATTPAEAALATALRATDLPEGWTVQANPVPDGDLADNPTLDGLCSASFSSEGQRTAKFPVVGIDPAGRPAVTSEAVAYGSADGAALALTELRTAFAGCESPEQRFGEPPSTEGLTADAVAAQYQLTTGTTQVIVAQARGAVVSIMVSDDPAVTLSAARSVATRMAQLPAAVIGA